MRFGYLACLILFLSYTFLVPADAIAQTQQTEFNNHGQVLTPTLLPAPQASLDPTTGNWTVTNELFNPTSGFYTVVAQKQIGPKNPSCPTCAPDLNFQPINSDPAPLSGTPVNEYGRLSWHTLEPTEGHYDFSVIDNVIEPCPASQGHPLCLPQGSTFGFRLMAFNPQYKSNTNITTGQDGYPVYSDVPAYIEKDGKGKSHGWLLPLDPADPTQGHYFIPDWNDPLVLDRIWALLDALGQKYNQDPRIGNLDIGLYGSWGEWHTAGLPDSQDYKWGAIPYSATNSYYDINTAAYQANNGVSGSYQVGTEDSKKSIIWAHVRAFPNKQLVMLTDDPSSLCTAMHINVGNLPIGLRRDSLGSYTGWQSSFPQNSSCLAENGYDLVANRWRVAPFITEPFGNGSSPTFPCQTFEIDPVTQVLAITEQVQQYHIASVKNGAFCTGTWSALTPAEQAAAWTSGLSTGYRYAPSEIWIPSFSLNAAPSLSLHTQWINTGTTPTYTPWNVEFSLWTYTSGTLASQVEMTSFSSTVDLRKIVPKTSQFYVLDETFPLPEQLPAGPYELRVRVIDPRGYANTMQLALQNETPDGYYPLGLVLIPSFTTGSALTPQ